IVLGKHLDKPALTDSFKIMITPHGTKVGQTEYADDEHSGFSQLVEAGKAAAVGVRGWSGNKLAMKIEARGPITADAPFTSAVRVKNTSGHKLDIHPWVDLSTEAALAGTEDAADQAPLQIESVDKEGSSEEWKKGAEDIALFKVTPHGK